MNEKPILFSSPMIRAILSGTKVQTRRAVKPRPPSPDHCLALVTKACKKIEGKYCWTIPGETPIWPPYFPCPYPVGTRLWVRETWGTVPDTDGAPIYRADGPHDGVTRWRPSIFMPRWASRITLEVLEVRVQRVQSISDADVLAEGVPPEAIDHWRGWLHPNDCPAHAFGVLWDSINGRKSGCSWADNPWCFCYSFRVIK